MIKLRLLSLFFSLFHSASLVVSLLLPSLFCLLSCLVPVLFSSLAAETRVAGLEGDVADLHAELKPDLHLIWSSQRNHLVTNTTN